MNQTVAKAFSYLLHPAIFPIIGLLFILKALPVYYNPGVVIITILMVFTGTYLIPLLVAFLLYRLKLVDNLHMHGVKERRLPYLITAVCFYVTASSLRQLSLVPEAYYFLLAASAVIVIHILLFFFFKPSAHLAAIGGFTGLIIALSLTYKVNYLPVVAAAIFLSGVLGSARYALQAHDLKELAVGFLSGFALVFCFVFFF